MSRHRNIRSMNYDEEYYGYDDVYGHSVEDDYATSPSAAQFMYDRDHSHQMSAYLRTEEDIQEVDEEEDKEMHSFERQDSSVTLPPLGDMEKAQLYSCLDTVRDRLGDSFSEQSAVNAILSHNFDVDKAINALLSETTRKATPLQPLKREPQIASLKDNRPNLNSSTTCKPSLSQLANLRLSGSAPTSNTGIGRGGLVNPVKVPSALPVGGLKPIRPSLAQLAKINITNVPLTLQVDKLEEKTKKLDLEPKESSKQQVVPRAAKRNPSSLGRVICEPSSRKPMNLKFNWKLLRQNNNEKPIVAFSFNTPSPDDNIKSRLGLMK